VLRRAVDPPFVVRVFADDGVRADAGRLAELFDVEPLVGGRRGGVRLVRAGAVRRRARRLTAVAPANATAKAATIQTVRPREGSASSVAVTGAVTACGGWTPEPVPPAVELVAGAVDGVDDCAVDA
jgi:hypothetical protein